MKEVSAKKVVWTSFVVDLVDILTNILVALATGSVVMAAETIQGIADLTAVGFLLFGISQANRRADSDHPFGFGREIYFWTLISSIVMLFFTASITFYLGLSRFLRPQVIDNIYLAFGVLILAICTNGYALFLDVKRLSHDLPKRRIIEHFFQSAHIETKTTFVLDLMGSLAAFTGLTSLVLLKTTSNQSFDGLGAMAVGLILGLLSLLLVGAVRELLVGRSASKKAHQQIKALVLAFTEVKKISKLKTIYMGSGKLLLHLDLHLKNNLSTDQIELLTTKIKHQISTDLPEITDIQVELSS